MTTSLASVEPTTQPPHEGCKLRLSLLGPMMAVDRAGRDVLPRVRKTRALLAVLAVAAPRTVQREELTGLLWSTRGRPQARASLRQSLHELQDMLGPIGSELLEVDRAQVALRAEGTWVDLRSAAAGQGFDPGLLRGPFLADLGGLDPAFDEWLARQRRRTSAIVRAALADVLEGVSGPEATVEAGSLLLALDPADEALYRTLMQAHAARGDLAEAESCFTRLLATLTAAGKAPSAETEFLHASLKAAACVSPPHTPQAEATIRIGVLPPTNDDAGAEDPLSLGLAEEITTALSQFRGISCVGTTTMWRLARTEAPSSEAFARLGLDFLLDGTIQRVDTRVRIKARLLDLRAGQEVVWVRRFDRDAADLFALQDEIAAEIAAQVDPALLLRQGTRGDGKSRAVADAHELTLRAIPAVYRLDPAGYREAGVLLQAAIALDPTYPAAHAWLAYWHLFLVGQGWADASGSSIMLAESLAERAIMLDPGDARALTLAGHVRAFLHRRVGEAIALHERALSLNPNLTWGWMFSSLAHTYAGSPAEGLRRATYAKRLAPLDPHGFMIDAAILLPLLTLRRFSEAAEVGEGATDAAPHFSANWKIRASALGHLGPDAQAPAVVNELLLREPAFTVRDAFARCPLLRPEDRDLYVDGLRKAGLPEGEEATA